MTGVQWLVALLLFSSALSSAATVNVIESSRGGSRFSKRQVSFEAQAPAGFLRVAINESDARQTILGFGGAFTEACAYNLFSLSEARQKELIDAYFGPNGNGYTVGRFHINSCDFSLGSYSFDDVAWDWDLANFDISHDEHTLLPFIAMALESAAAAGRSIKLFGSPWSPPWWMKTGAVNYGFMLGSESPGLNATCGDVWARYLSRVISEYQNRLGVQIWGLTPQNEPEFAAPWEACTYTPQQELAWIAGHLGPVMRRDHPDLKIMLYDHNKDHIANWTRAMVEAPDAAAYVDGVAFHWYTGPQFENLAEAVAMAPNKFFLASEACNCPGVVVDSWPRAENYVYDILGDLNAGAVGWTDWNLCLNSMGGPNHLEGYCDAAVITYSLNDSLHFQPVYYTYGQVTRFVVPGTIVHGTESDALLAALSIVSGVRPDGQRVMVLFNPGDYSEDIALVRTGTGSITTEYAAITVAPHSVTTLLWNN